MIYENHELLLDVNLSLSFKNDGVEAVILRGINFQVFNTVQPGSGIPRPQVVALLGPSGVGKTQLFRCIAGLQVPTEGAVYTNSNTDPVHEGEVGVVAQDYPLIETRTVLGNLTRAFNISIRRMEARKEKLPDSLDAKAIAMDYLGKFGLTKVAGHYPSQLSGGQRQRVSIVQQMICSRHFLLMDEPFSGLDLIAKERAMELITEMANADELNTVIITTHDVRSACAVADRVIMLGHERDTEGNKIPGARIMADIDLKAEDLCWVPGITKTQQFRDFVAKVEEAFHEL